MLNKGVFLLGMIVLCASCGSKKTAVPKIAPGVKISAAGESIRSFEMNNLDFHTFSGRAKAKLQWNDQAHDATLHVRIRRDQTIWLSVTAILGLEVARLLITPDSIRMLNKLQGEYMAKPFGYVHRYTGRSVDFGTLQDLLLANVSANLLRTDDVRVAESEDEFVVIGRKDELDYQYRINTENRPFHFNLEEVGSGRHLETYYTDFAKTDGYNFPRSMALNIRAEDLLLKAQLAYSRVTFNEQVEIPFTVPGRYKEIL